MKANYLKYILFSTFLLSPFSLLYANTSHIGINETNLSKIPVGIINLGLPDTDKDGLDDDLEKSLGTNYQKKDSDNDSFGDKTEIENNYNPIGKNKIILNTALAQKLGGQYLLRVEQRGELWYVNPKDNRRYLIGNATRKKLLFEKLNPVIVSPAPTDNASLMPKAAAAIRNRDKQALLKLITPQYKNAIDYTYEYLKTDEKKLLWSGMFEGMKLVSQTDSERIYNTQIYFGLASKNVTVEFREAKQPDGTWLISKL